MSLVERGRVIRDLDEERLRTSLVALLRADGHHASAQRAAAGISALGTPLRGKRPRGLRSRRPTRPGWRDGVRRLASDLRPATTSAAGARHPSPSHRCRPRSPIGPAAPRSQAPRGEALPRGPPERLAAQAGRTGSGHRAVHRPVPVAERPDVARTGPHRGARPAPEVRRSSTSRARSPRSSTARRSMPRSRSPTAPSSPPSTSRTWCPPRTASPWLCRSG